MKAYAEFLEKKRLWDKPSGHEPEQTINPKLFPFQADIVRWALRRGRAAVFADCGLGKTPIQLEWAHHVAKKERGPVLILAPLAVAEQTHDEGEKFNISVRVCEGQEDVHHGVNVTNYEKLHRFDPSAFVGVVLDESSIIKDFEGQFRNLVIDSFSRTPYRLACTATPAPNDWAELGNHCEFLGIMSRMEMLAMFFINDASDTGTWRLKGHAKSREFWRWLCSWAVMLSAPSDLGYSDEGFQLPELRYHEHRIPTSTRGNGFLPDLATDMRDRRRIRKETVEERCRLARELVNKEEGNWVLWCGLNAESELLASLISGAVEVTGSQPAEEKAASMRRFAREGGVIITKPRIAGRGMNWQIARRMAFVGLNDSWEDLYQAVRRLWRFGQQEPVDVHLIIEEREGSVLENVKRKDEQARAMVQAMVGHTKTIMRAEIGATGREATSYEPVDEMEIPKWIA